MADPWLPDPSPALVALYRHVQRTRMIDLPIVNRALDVEAVAFAPWDGHWFGVMLTPWFMNLVLAPHDPSAWRALPRGEKRVVRFPAGEFEFIGAHEDEVGAFAIASLFSPVLEFEDHATARCVAACARDAMLEPVHSPGARAASQDADGSWRAPLTRADLVHARTPERR
jgi:[NiFe] hydrogenase assembly HybE family chaperone